jgi:hypothetical protein
LDEWGGLVSGAGVLEIIGTPACRERGYNGCSDELFAATPRCAMQLVMFVIILVAEEILVELVAMGWDQMPALLLVMALVAMFIAVPALLRLITRIVPAMLLIGLVLPAMRIVSARVIRLGGCIATIRSLRRWGGGALVRRLRPLVWQIKTGCRSILRPEPRSEAAYVILCRWRGLALIIVLRRRRLAAQSLVVGLLKAGAMSAIRVRIIALGGGVTGEKVIPAPVAVT